MAAPCAGALAHCHAGLRSAPALSGLEIDVSGIRSIALIFGELLHVFVSFHFRTDGRA